MTPRVVPLPLLALLLTAACGREEVAVYRVPKEIPAAPEPDAAHDHDHDHAAHEGAAGLPEGHPPLEGMDAASAQAAGIAPAPAPEKRLRWTTPTGWREKPGTGFRYASFEVPGPGAAPGDLSVTRLAGDGGGLLSNVNRWRDQIGLAALDEAGLERASERLALKGRTALLVQFVSDAPLAGDESKKRLLAAIVNVPDGVWFFKLTGADALVRAAEADFRSFLKSVEGL